ncbi:MAG: hypothetical protein LiPW15_217 [Parcubacteria group bacterium LiPW_15]|nr:MAG: hypothetical protein LiPW15_217 [Parcubacteria group bacterium LiPW_15]
MKKSSLIPILSVIALTILLLPPPKGPSADPRNAPVTTSPDKLAVAIGGGQRDPMNLFPPDNHKAKTAVIAPQFEENTSARPADFFLIDSDGSTSTVHLPDGWEIMSVQRHGLPLNLHVGFGDDAYHLAVELNEASERLAHTYTVTCRVSATFKTAARFEVRTLTIPGEKITFDSP